MILILQLALVGRLFVFDKLSLLTAIIPYSQDVGGYPCIIPAACLAYVYGGLDREPMLHALVAVFCNHVVQIICGLQKYDNISAARCCLGWLPFHLLVQYHALNLMYIMPLYLRQLSSAMYSI